MRPLQNRVLPTGDIVAVSARGLFTGNRGVLHRERQLLNRRWTHPHWLICALTHPSGRYHGPMPEGRWTALFFLDEAVALAAGHRPCAECRREAYLSWRTAWATAHGPSSRLSMDRALHKARVSRGRCQIRHTAPVDTLPDGCFILWRGEPHMVRGDFFYRYETVGYSPATPRMDGHAEVLTPAPSVAALAAGYRPVLHPSAALT